MTRLINFLFAFCLLTSTPLWSDTTPSEPVKAEIIANQSSLQPGTPFIAGVRIELDHKWHAYWKNPGDTGMPIQISWDLPSGYTVEMHEWPYPKAFNHDGIITYGYEDEVVFLATITPPATIPEQQIPLKASVKWVACSDEMCLPGSAEISIALNVGQDTPQENLAHKNYFEAAFKKIPDLQEGITARKNGDLIELHLPHGINKSTNAYFFPDSMGDTSPTIEPLIALNDNHQIVILKTGPNFRLNRGLHGTLVLEDATGAKQSLAINSDVASDAIEREPIVMATPLISESGLGASPELSGGFWMAFGFAFLGGIILNLMPCVLPVISLKILSFVKLSGEDRSKILKHGLAYSLGVLLSFWTLAGLLLVFQSYGSSVGWGFQLQNPAFIAVLIAIIFLFSLSLFGVFEMGTSLMSVAGKAEGKSSGLGNAMLSGVLATAVATPCTGPFLGTAIGIATTLSTPLAMLVFTSLGLGMASPYLLFSAFPSTLKYLPKPGNWMVTFKEFTGFFMVGTVLWLLWVFSAQTGSSALIMILASLFFLAIAAWIFGKWSTPLQKKSTRFIGYLFSFALLALSGTALYVATAQTPAQNEAVAYSNWEEFSPERIKELNAQGTPVFVDFTAKWCLICQANHVVLTTNQVEKAFDEQGIVRMKADWTLHDDTITEELRKFGRNGVPLYVYYPVNGDPVILPQVLTPDVVTNTISESTIAKTNAPL